MQTGRHRGTRYERILHDTKDDDCDDGVDRGVGDNDYQIGDGMMMVVEMMTDCVDCEDGDGDVDNVMI